MIRSYESKLNFNKFLHLKNFSSWVPCTRHYILVAFTGHSAYRFTVVSLLLHVIRDKSTVFLKQKNICLKIYQKNYKSYVNASKLSVVSERIQHSMVTGLPISRLQKVKKCIFLHEGFTLCVSPNVTAQMTRC